MKVYYIIPLNYQLIGHPENFKIKLYYFQERLSLSYSKILKLLSSLHFVYVSSEKLTSKRTYFLKSIHKVEYSVYYFLYH